MHDRGYQCSTYHQWWVLICLRASKCLTENPTLVLLPRTTSGTNSHKMGSPECRFWKIDLHIGPLLGSVVNNTCRGVRKIGWEERKAQQGWTWKVGIHQDKGVGPINSYLNQSVDADYPWRGSHNIRTSCSICLKAICGEEFRFELSTCKTTGS